MKYISYIDNLEHWEKEFYFFIPVSVRFSETDMFGHMNNTVPFSYFEEARIEFFKELGIMQQWMEENNETIPVVANLQCDYAKQVYFGESLRVYVKTAAVGNSSVDIHYLAKNNEGEICFVGRGTMVNISRKTGKGVPWPEEWKQKLSK